MIMPDFIASEHIPSPVKEFYRKSSNSYLKNDLLRVKAHQLSLTHKEQFHQVIEELRLLEKTLATNKK